MLTAGISSLQFSAFRNYAQLQLELRASLIVIIGDNGVGKTNILEALSLLSPGKGLRSSKLSQMTTFDITPLPCWTVAANLKEDGFDTILGTGLEYTSSGSEKRRLKINGNIVRSQADFAEHLNVIWIVPAMARLFQESGSIRRKFVDRMAYAFDPTHTNRLHRYEHYLRERSTLLREGRGDSTWLASLEKNLAEDGIAIVHARAEVVRNVTEHQPTDSASPFPRFFAQMRGEVEEWCRHMTAVAAEEKLRLAFANNRTQDAHTGGSVFGPHRSDLFVKHLGKQIPAELCSTGEQKMLLIALTLAFTKVQMEQSNRVTLLLLDDVIAHLDSHYRHYLFQELCQMVEKGAKLQTWMTGTSLSDFVYLKQSAQYIRIKNTTLYDGYDDNDS
ncbi:DNA replication/repair protein RecF [Candidatus Paracaedibacter symbiosus]|uniref:DNA replication/repair protein RecF n=1 Tax=Candidatus Paracaedibacter symbiosus TaxID=244582 RepID=UPI0005099878|nr:DNA replication/repair protein RecF [Candidatus Paracaedibacter symbiosus]